MFATLTPPGCSALANWVLPAGWHLGEVLWGGCQRGCWEFSSPRTSGDPVAFGAMTVVLI